MEQGHGLDLVPDNNLVDIIGGGRSFFFVFDDDFIDQIRCLISFSWDLGEAMYPSVRFLGDSGIMDNVAAYWIEGRIWFGGSSWAEFVSKERIVRGDQGLFILIAPHNMALRLYRFNGPEKPLHQRPAIWNEVAYSGFMYGDNAQQNRGNGDGVDGAPDAGVEVAEHLRDMKWLLAPFLQTTGPLMQTFSDVWNNYPNEYPMYGVQMLYSHTESYAFTFGVTMSSKFPEGVDIPAVFYLGDDDDRFVRGSIKRYMKQDNNARINKGRNVWCRNLGYTLASGWCSQ